MTDLASQLLDEEEGPSSPTVYPDTRGYATIARGVCVDKRVVGAGLSPAVLAQIDALKLTEAYGRAEDLPGFQRCNDVRQAVLVSMCFQLGTLADWPHFKAALALGNYDMAADAGLQSIWATETPKRAQREMQMLRTGEWVPHE